MISRTYIDHLRPTEENAKNMLRLINAEAKYAGISEGKSAEIANPDNDEHVAQKLREIYVPGRSSQYLGSFLVDNEFALAGFMHTYSWEKRIGEKPVFDSMFGRLALAAYALTSGNVIIINPFVVSPEIASRKLVAEDLIRRVISDSGDSEVFVAVNEDDNDIVDVLQRTGFDSTGISGVNGGVDKTLYQGEGFHQHDVICQTQTESLLDVLSNKKRQFVS